MPIIDPSLQISLLEKYNPLPKDYGLGFFFTYLRIAAHNINRNINTIEASIKFKERITPQIASFLISTFKCNIDREELNNPLITNVYKYLYNKIRHTTKENKIKQGIYQICTDKYQTKLFQIKILFDGPHAWFISDTPIAILCIKKSDIDLRAFGLIKLEIFLMAAAGYTLVLCMKGCSYTSGYILDLIKSNQFSEIHFNFNYSDFYEEFSEFEESFQEYNGYFYFYSNFVDHNNKEKEDLISNLKKFKRFPRMHFISFSNGIFDGFETKDFQLLHTKPFPYCKCGFHHEYIPIRLSNIPLYDSDDDTNSFIPALTSGLSLGYISKDDFLKWKTFRVKIIFIDSTNQKIHTEKYINFDDIHKVKSDLYVKDQLTLAKVNAKMLEKVNIIEKNIYEKIYERKDKKFIRDNIITLIKDKKIMQSLEYVAYAYYYVKYMKGYKFLAHRTQIYTAYEACRRFIIKKKDEKTKGAVFQVETGEGKSCIVCLIAAALALMEKTVHITSSNIKLSIRDFEDSYRFFKLLKLRSAVLVHSNELPLAVRKKFQHDNIEMNAEETEKERKNADTKNEANKKDKETKSTDKKDKDAKVSDEKDKETKSTDKKDKDTKVSDEKDKEIESTDKKDKDTKVSDEKDKKKNIAKSKGNGTPNGNSEIEIDSFFGTNSDNYLKQHTESTEFNTTRYYKEKYYGAHLFRNSSRMNYSICGFNEQEEESSNKAQIIFSTFVNFECFYLKMVELCPGSIQKSFSKYGLLVDEADSMLIDEIANGTIVSRSMNSNAVEILKFVYDQYHKKVPFSETYEKVTNEPKWANCKKLIRPDHIEQMYKEIELVHSPEYENGKRYSVEKIEVKKKKKINKYFKKVLNFSLELAYDIGKEFIKEFAKDPIYDEDDEDDDEDEGEEDEDENNASKTVTFRHIVPFSYDRNGILEPNREFSGFIQQFIAIKESSRFENMIVNDISMSYLYISHPIFVKLYGTVCGFTGTVGNKYDKQIFKDQYSLITMKVPRHNPNLSVEFPMILCKDKKERNHKIVSEVLEFHKRGNPVLVIFQDLKEIKDLQRILIANGIKYINVFDGRDEVIKPDLIAGMNGSISLGTNVCGRGTNIKAKGLPLHVIVSYNSSNTRVMKQAFGRTARQGRKGTYRVICLKSEYYEPFDVLKNTETLLDEFSIKNKLQKEFVDHFEKNRSWIFSGFPGEQKIDGKMIQNLRETKINVNRIVASNYIFPICMNIKTFMKIQEQRIFSLFNCPNSRFTWRLFQKYLREFILESWSLLINEVDQQFENNKQDINYESTIQARMKNLFAIFDKKYLPPRSNGSIVETFMFLFAHVRKKYEDKILDDFSSSNLACPLLSFNPSEFFCCRVGFKPYALLSDSGARICSKNFKKMNFIKDPELIFQQKTIKNKYKLISITEKIDDIFNEIVNTANKILGSKTFLKLFLRRTIAGCEFGFCLNLDIKNNNKEFIDMHPYCIIDRDPLLVFTIFVRSFLPILAIIMISLLVYLASIAKEIAKWFTFPSNVKEAVTKTLSIVINTFASKIADEIYEKIIDFLSKNLENNIKQIHLFDVKSSDVISSLKNLFEAHDVENAINKIDEYLDCKFEFRSKLGDIGSSFLNPVHLMRISAYLLLLLASFIMLFRHRKKDLDYYNTKSKEFNDNPTEENLKKMCDEMQNEEKVESIPKVSDEEKNKYDVSYKEESGKYLFKLIFFKLVDKTIEPSLFEADKRTLIKKGITSLVRGIYTGSKKECIRITYSGNKKIFEQQIRLYSTNQFPSIIHLVGYTIERNKKQIFLDYKENGTLKSLIHSGNKIDLTHKLIIAYGIACAMNHLHNNKIVHRYLKPSNIFLDSDFHPYLSNFHRAKQIEIPFPYQLKSMSLKYEPPEFLDNYAVHQDSFALDVYSFGMVLYSLITEKMPYYSYSKSRDELIKDIKNNKVKPAFPDSFSSDLDDWRKLIIQCWNEKPEDRPSFKNIVSDLASKFIKNKSIDKEMFMNYKTKFD